jgi:hypothetical protein
VVLSPEGHLSRAARVAGLAASMAASLLDNGLADGPPDQARDAALARLQAAAAAALRTFTMADAISIRFPADLVNAASMVAACFKCAISLAPIDEDGAVARLPGPLAALAAHGMELAATLAALPAQQPQGLMFCANLILHASVQFVLRGSGVIQALQRTGEGGGGGDEPPIVAAVRDAADAAGAALAAGGGASLARVVRACTPGTRLHGALQPRQADTVDAALIFLATYIRLRDAGALAAVAAGDAGAAAVACEWLLPALRAAERLEGIDALQPASGGAGDEALAALLLGKAGAAGPALAASAADLAAAIVAAYTGAA